MKMIAMIQPNKRSKVSSLVEVEGVTSCFVFWFGTHPISGVPRAFKQEAPSLAGRGFSSRVD